MEKFVFNKEYEAICIAERTQSGFRHVCTLLRNGQEIDSTKRTYLNRTWESYDFQSTLSSLVESDQLSIGQHIAFRKLVQSQFQEENKKKIDKEFGAIAMVASLGNIFGKNKKESNDWKTRMIKAGLENKGLIMPEDWNELNEDTKETRLNSLIQHLKGGEAR